MSGRARRLRGLLLKGAVSVVLVAVLLSRLSLAEIREALAGPDWRLLAAALVVYAVSAWGGAVQWSWILRVSGLRTPTRELHRLYFVGLFFNNFLPANVGGDAIKILDLGRQEGRPLKVFCATLLDRLVGLTGLTGLALVAVAGAAALTAKLPPVYPLFVALVLWLGALAVLLSRRVASRLAPLLRRLRLRRLGDAAEAAAREFALYRERVGWFFGLLGFATVVQVLRVLVHVVVAYALGVHLSGIQALQLFVLVPLLGILIALPISINGIGLREGASALTFTFAGIAPAAAVAIELTAYLVQVAFSLVGGWLFWRGRRRASPLGPEGGR